MIRRTALFVAIAMVISFVLALAGSSIKNTVQVLFLPIADGFGVDRGTLALATTVFAVVTGLISPVIGHLADRIGAVPVLMIGTGATGVIFMLCATVTNIWLFVLGYGVLAAIGFTMLANIPLGVLITQLFRERNQGLFYAVLVNGSAVGFIVLVPLWTYLNVTLTWNRIMFGLGVVFLVILLPLTFVLLRFSARTEKPVVKSRATLRHGVRTTIRDSRVRAPIIAFCACGVTMAFVEVHLFPHMHDHGVSPVVGSISVSVLGIAQIAGGLIAGRLCDIGMIRRTLIGAYLLRACAMALLPFFASDSVVIVFGAIFGASYLTVIVATTMWITRAAAPGNVGTGIGLMWTLHMLAYGLSSQLGAVLADIQGSYLSIILASTGIALAAAVLIATKEEPGAREAEDPAERRADAERPA